MRDLHSKPLRNAGKNRLRKVQKERKPLDLRPLFRKAARGCAAALAVAVVVAVVAGGYRFFSTTVFFRLDRIEIVGNHRLDRQEVLSHAGVSEGKDLLKVNVARVGEHLEKNPWIETVRVRRFFPHSLTIEVTEREPVAVVNVGVLYYLDRKGEIFKPLSEGDRLDFPVITGFTDEDMIRDPSGTKQGLTGAAALVSALGNAGEGFRAEDVSEIHFDKGFGFTLFTVQGGVPVKLGNDGFGEKLERLAKIYDDLKPGLLAVEYIDLNYSDKIVVKKA